MPIRFDIDETTNTLFTRAHDILTDIDLFSHRDALKNHPGFRPNLRELADVQGVTRFDLTAKTFAYFFSNILFGDGARRAVVAGRNSIALDMAMLYRNYRQDAPYSWEVFVDVDEAREWLELATG